jgi:hypothetical protein
VIEWHVANAACADAYAELIALAEWATSAWSTKGPACPPLKLISAFGAPRSAAALFLTCFSSAEQPGPPELIPLALAPEGPALALALLEEDAPPEADTVNEGPS